MYNVSSVGVIDVDDVSEGGDDVDVDASEWSDAYPSSEMLFWKDIDIIYHQ
jgi:hypothetical protein